MRIKIIPPYWMAWWFRFIVGILLLIIVYSFYFWRVAEYKRTTRERERFSERLLESQEHERKRIAHDLHDSLGQDLLVVKNTAVYGAQLAEEHPKAKSQFDFISEVISESIQKVRQISYNLHPYQLDKLGLTEAITAMIHTIEESNIHVKFLTQIENVNKLLTKEREINFFRVLQELLNNIIKHSQATEVTITIVKYVNELCMTVFDNGKGYSSSRQGKDEEKSEGIGLSGIADRVRIMGGVQFVLSAPEKGTKVRIYVPFDSSGEEHSKQSGKKL